MILQVWRWEKEVGTHWFVFRHLEEPTSSSHTQSPRKSTGAGGAQTVPPSGSLKVYLSLGTSQEETTKPNQALQPGGKKANLLGLNQHTAGYRREKKKKARRVVFSPQPSKQTDFAVVLEQFALCWEEESSRVHRSVYGECATSCAQLLL